MPETLEQCVSLTGGDAGPSWMWVSREDESGGGGAGTTGVPSSGGVRPLRAGRMWREGLSLHCHCHQVVSHEAWDSASPHRTSDCHKGHAKPHWTRRHSGTWPGPVRRWPFADTVSVLKKSGQNPGVDFGWQKQWQPVWRMLQPCLALISRKPCVAGKLARASQKERPGPSSAHMGSTGKADEARLRSATHLDSSSACGTSASLHPGAPRSEATRGP